MSLEHLFRGNSTQCNDVIKDGHVDMMVRAKIHFVRETSQLGSSYHVWNQPRQHSSCHYKQYNKD